MQCIQDSPKKCIHRQRLERYVDQCGGRHEAAKVLDYSYSGISNVLNGNRGVSPKTAILWEIASNGRLKVDSLVRIRPTVERVKA